MPFPRSSSPLALLVLIALTVGCSPADTGPASEPSSSPSSAATPTTIPAQGPCDEPLLDGDVVVGGDSSDATSSADGPLYDSVVSLARAADAVVIGTVGSEVGGDDRQPVRELTDVEVVRGDVASPLQVRFWLGDTAGERCAPVVEGRRVLVFLTEPVGEPPVRSTIGSHNNGVLSIVEGQALTHTWVPDRLGETDPSRNELPADGSFPPPGLAFDLDEVRNVVYDTVQAGLLVPLDVRDVERARQDPSASSLLVEVAEIGCSGGVTDPTRVEVVDLYEDDQKVLVDLAFRPRDGPFECPGNPWAELTIPLAEPLGDREFRVVSIPEPG